MPRFTHLHTHSEYSLLDGLARVPDLVQTAKDRGFEALALTDHGVMFGAVQFFQQSVKAGIKPLLGCEVYVAKRGRGDRDPVTDRKPYHLTVLAENEIGYRNLMAMVSAAQLEGFYYSPRVDRELLQKYGEGLIVLSGCAGSEVSNAIIEGRMSDARAAMDWYRQVFAGRYYVELMVHDLQFIPALNRGLLQLAEEFDLPTVATNDVHYCRETDVRAHEVLLCVQTGTTMNDPKRMRLGGETYYLRTEEEMRRLFAEMPGAIDRTAEIVERCNVTLTFNEYKLPKFDVPAGKTAGEYLLELCRAGLAGRYTALTPEIEQRLAFELSIIGQMGFDDYFLIVWDLCRYAADQGVWWNVRGSGAGSIVAYALRITNIDPLAHKLIFERFLNPSRVSMPDIDLDFPDDQRDLVIRYTFQKYGHDRVAQIITFGTMGARAAVRDAGRALDMELDTVDRVARLIPAVPGKACTIADTLRPTDEGGEANEFYSPDLVALRDIDEGVLNLLDTARSLEGVARHASTHAAGVVISDRPLIDYVPLHRPTKGGSDEQEQLAVTQFDMNDVEQLGLLKVDFLGLATLTVLRRAAELVERYHGKKYTLDTIPLDDEKTFALLSSGNTAGVFQVEGAGMRRMLREMQPRKFEHIVAAIALYRPGPMEYIPTYIRRLHGREKVEYRHPRLEPILDETYGIIVYQEQIIQIARDLFGYDAGEADLIRKAVSKKIKEKLLQHRKQFRQAAASNDIPPHVADGIFDDIETFARYGFNKAHAADYAVIVCQTAYLKAHYPVEYAAALLSVERDDTEKIAFVAADCRRNGIALLKPDINASELDFTIETLDADARAVDGVTRKRGIRFGLGAIKNVGQGAVQALLDGRAESGPFKDLDELCLGVDLRQVGKRAIESLIKAGAFDGLGSRAQLLAVVDRMVSASSAHHQAAEVGQMSLFGDLLPAAQTSMLYPLPQAHGDLTSELAWEKELIGLYLSEHPLHRISERMAESITVMVSDITPEIDGQPVTLAGMVTRIRRIVTKKGSAMAFARIEDLSGEVELTLFPRTYEQTKDLWVEDAIVLVHGRAEVRNERTQVIVNSVEPYRPDEEVEAPEAATEALSWTSSGTSGGDLVPRPTVEDEADRMSGGDGESKHGADHEAKTVPATNGSSPNGSIIDRSAANGSSSDGPSARDASASVPTPTPTSTSTDASTTAADRAPNGASTGAPDPTARPDGTTYELEVTLPPSAEASAGVTLLGDIFHMLSGFEGVDRFTFLVPNGPEIVELEFPNSSTRYCVDLLRKLEAKIGAGRIKVTARQPADAKRRPGRGSEAPPGARRP